MRRFHLFSGARVMTAQTHLKCKEPSQRRQPSKKKKSKPNQGNTNPTKKKKGKDK